MQIPPWLNPPNFLGAAQSGAQLGAQIRGQNIQSQEQADRMRLSWAEQAFKQQMAQQDQEQAQQQAQQRAIAAMMQQNQFGQELALSRDKLALDQAQGEAGLAQRDKSLQASILNQVADNKRLDLGAAETNRHNLIQEGHLKALEDQAKLKGSEPRPLTQTAEANIINQLSKQWTGAVKTAQELDRSISLMDAGLTAARRGDMAAGSQAVLVTFQKILDPTSVVRESEYARSAAGQSLLNRVQGAFEKLASGGAGVPISELEKFAQLAKEASEVQKKVLPTVRTRIGKTADRYNIPNELVLDDRGMGGSGEIQQPSTSSASAPSILGGKPNGKYTLTDGSVWIVEGGKVRKGN